MCKVNFILILILSFLLVTIAVIIENNITTPSNNTNIETTTPQVAQHETHNPYYRMLLDQVNFDVYLHFNEIRFFETNLTNNINITKFSEFKASEALVFGEEGLVSTNDGYVLNITLTDVTARIEYVYYVDIVLFSSHSFFAINNFSFESKFYIYDEFNTRADLDYSYMAYDAIQKDIYLFFTFPFTSGIYFNNQKFLCTNIKFEKFCLTILDEVLTTPLGNDYYLVTVYNHATALNSVYEKIIKVGIRYNQYVEILEGLEIYESIITSVIN